MTEESRKETVSQWLDFQLHERNPRARYCRLMCARPRSPICQPCAWSLQGYFRLCELRRDRARVQVGPPRRPLGALGPPATALAVAGASPTAGRATWGFRARCGFFRTRRGALASAAGRGCGRGAARRAAPSKSGSHSLCLRLQVAPGLLAGAGPGPCRLAGVGEAARRKQVDARAATGPGK